MSAREVISGGLSVCGGPSGPSVWERTTHFGPGHHKIHVFERVVVEEALNVYERARYFDAGRAVLRLLNRLYRY